MMQQEVDPAKIEQQLIQIWEGLAKENKMRACLFNLIVYNCVTPRSEYVRAIAQKVIEKFPCRVLFVAHDPKSEENYLKTAVSVIMPMDQESTIACDHIDIRVAGADVERVPSLILPHIIPDLPVYLLWTEDPCKPNPLFAPFSKMATRIIFDSESADNLYDFAQTLLTLFKSGIDIADLNWARTEGWRDLIASLFDTRERMQQLSQLINLQITYNSRETATFCHLKVQAVYLLAWFSARLGWKYQSAEQNLQFHFEKVYCPREGFLNFDASETNQNRSEAIRPMKEISEGNISEEEDRFGSVAASQNFNKSIARSIEASIQPTLWEKLGSGTIVSVEMKTKEKFLFQCMRLPRQYHRVGIQISNAEKCDLPYQFVLGQTATGQSLVNEITKNNTSVHYVEMLNELINWERDILC